MQYRTPNRTGIKVSPCARAARESGQAGVVDMVVLTGLDLTVCAIVNAFKVPVPAGTQPESSTP
jgi:hypothetical protein